MPLVYITGNSGAGKSAVRKELQKRGYEAHDTDENDISSWQNKQTGNIVERPSKEVDRTNDWYSQHDWNMARSKIDNLARIARDRLIFLCGSTSNADEMLDLFDRVYYLSIDENTLKDRLRSRTDNDFGKAPDELNNILSWHKSLEERFKDHGAYLLDAAQPLTKVVDEILSTLD